ncbi:MAG: enoyl-CoA hydratase/isomerase family protein [Pseudomonadaceae bacterium]|nr:enoyl-CoA hydratase/isomerase family protein [Pseudomonadaceae bacterium]
MSRFDTLTLEIDGRIAWVTFDHPPINLLDMQMIKEIDQLSEDLYANESLHAVVFQSADPDFFIAHADVGLIRSMPTDITERPTELNLYVAALERLRKLPFATIGKVAGIARGGGAEFLWSLDMRFAAVGRTTLSQPEVALGILPSGSGSARLPHLVGRGRSLEIALACEDFSAELAQDYGLVNRAVPQNELDGLVERIATRLASFPRSAIESTKLSIDASLQDPTHALLEEAHQFNWLRGTRDAQQRMAAFVESSAQTREGELKLDSILLGLSDL